MHKSKLLGEAEEEKMPELLLHTHKTPNSHVVPYTAVIYPVTLRHFHSSDEKFIHKCVLQ